MSEAKVEAIEKYGLSKKDSPKSMFSKIGIVGCGTVGQTIARMVATRGIEIVFIETSEEKINTAIRAIEADLDAMIDHWGMTSSEKKGILGRIKGSLDCKSLVGCDLVIEAITSKTREQRIEARKEVFKRVEQHVNEDAIIATNSTTIAITELSSELKHKDRCVSLHFSTTYPEANIVEVVKGLYTSDETFSNVERFVKLIGKKLISVEESPGLISVRLFAALINESCDVLMEGVASKEDIDLTSRTSLGLALGPFEMADKIGLDKVLRWLDNLYNEFGDMKYKASPIIKKLVRANQLGRSSQKGFYAYDENGKKINE